MVRERLPLLVAVTLAGAVAACAAGALAEKEYTATGYVFYRPLEVAEVPPVVDPSVPDRARYQGSSLEVIARRTSRRLPSAGDAQAVREAIATEYQAEPQQLTIRATARRAGLAARLANVFALEYARFWRASDARRLREAIAVVSGRLEDTDEADRRDREGRRRLGELRGLQRHGPARATVISRAPVPGAPSSPSLGERATTGAALGLLVGLALAALLERRRRG